MNIIFSFFLQASGSGDILSLFLKPGTESNFSLTIFFLEKLYLLVCIGKIVDFFINFPYRRAKLIKHVRKSVWKKKFSSAPGLNLGHFRPQCCIDIMTYSHLPRGIRCLHPEGAVCIHRSGSFRWKRTTPEVGAATG